MEIVAGTLKNRKFFTLKGAKVVESRIRKVLFDVLGDWVQTKSVCDCFGGMGSLGIEALSWGAREVTFIEHDHKRVTVIQQNLESFSLAGQAEVVEQDIFEYLSEISGFKCFDLIFLDPPYHENLVTKSLKYIERYDIVNAKSFLVVLHFFKETVEIPLVFREVFSRQYGDRKVIILETK